MATHIQAGNFNTWRVNTSKWRGDGILTRCS